MKPRGVLNTSSRMRVLRRRAASCSSACLVAFAIAGCGGGMSSVEGKVTLDGKPIEGGPEMYGTVTFVPEGGGGAPSVGIIGSGGKYSVATGSQTGMKPGNYLVGIAIKKVHPPTDPNGMSRPEMISPPKYASVSSSGFRAEVGQGSNTFDFALESGAGSQ
jgi:hypothetical protein